VLVHIDTAHGGEHLINRRLAYVAVSRGRFEAHIYTNDKATLMTVIDRDVARHSAMEMLPIGKGRSDCGAAIAPQRCAFSSELGWNAQRSDR
jgi:hypothetical protein